MDNEELNETETDNNDDMLAKSTDINDTLSFAVSEPPAPERSWTKQQKREVWIVAAVATILVAIGGFILKAFGYI